MSTARYRIAMLAMLTLIFVVVASFYTVIWRTNVPIDNLMRLLEVLFAPLVALVGIAVAFYYRDSRDSRGNPP